MAFETSISTIRKLIDDETPPYRYEDIEIEYTIEESREYVRQHEIPILSYRGQRAVRLKCALLLTLQELYLKPSGLSQKVAEISEHDSKIRYDNQTALKLLQSYRQGWEDELKQIIRARSYAGVSEMPFLPMWPAAQVFASNLEFVDFQNGSGVRFLTMYGQDMTPINNQSLFYTFQGLTDDGRYYVSAILPITHPELPGDSMVDDWQSFEQSYQTYMTETLEWLVAQPTTSFNPSLTDLDSMITTILVDRDNEPLGLIIE